jgi:inner membrane protein
MFSRTHIVIAIFFTFILFQNSPDFLLLLFVAVTATLIPDMDSKTSKIGRKKISRLINFFTKHRGIVHSLFFLVISSIVIFFVWKEILLPFMLGYLLHLVGDSFTIQGTRIFYPFKVKIRGVIKTGGITEFVLFTLFCLADLFLIINKFYSII